jgi:ABC-type multidrug transport system ATPase subunit
VSPPALAVRGLEKRFGPVLALRAVAFEVPEATLCAVLGPNGAGKSTLLRCLSGLARPSAGSVEIGGERVERGRLRARVGLVAHATFLYAELSVRENLVFAARLHGLPDARARAERLLAEDALADWAERRAGTLSRGLAQRAALARARVHDPPLLLLDEPFTGLDPRSAERLVVRLCELRAQGRTIVLVSHDLARAAELADRAVVLQHGRVVAEASAPSLDAAHLAAALADA